MSSKNNDNKSLIIYTSLIFFVAIVMIVVSFLAQTHLEQAQVTKQEEERVSLSNKAAQVSEENMQLVELNKNLRETNQALNDEKNALTEQNEAMSKEIAGYEALMQVYDKLYDGDKTAARTLLEGIFTENLSEPQKEFYDILVKKAQ